MVVSLARSARSRSAAGQSPIDRYIWAGLGLLALSNRTSPTIRDDDDPAPSGALLRGSGRSRGEAPGAQRGVTLSGTTWIPDGDLGLAQWLDHGRRLGLLGRGVAWWIGDWIRYGNARYGEKYTRAARVTGYDVQSLMNMAYVASRFEPARRRATLSWSHHAEVAAFDAERQERLLDLAEREHLSVQCLRLEIRAVRRSIAREQTAGECADDPAHTAPEHGVVCPKCKYVIEVAHP